MTLNQCFLYSVSLYIPRLSVPFVIAAILFNHSFFRFECALNLFSRNYVGHNQGETVSFTVTVAAPGDLTVTHRHPTHPIPSAISNAAQSPGLPSSPALDEGTNHSNKLPETRGSGHDSTDPDPSSGSGSLELREAPSRPGIFTFD